jgi:tRNA(Ser,Leu) C12 N-acetylase TAN1
MSESTVLEEIKQYRQESELIDSEIRQKIDELTKKRYDPLFDFFVQCLDDPKPGWREKALAKIHYFKPKIDKSTLEKIRSIALDDPNKDVRVRACGTLGNVSVWPEATLTRVIETENNPFVLGAATNSILVLRGVPPYVALEQFNKISSGNIKPDSEYIERLVEINGKK